MYEREFWMSSTVKRIAAVAAAGSRRRNSVRIKKVYVLIMDRRARKNEDTKSQNNEAAKSTREDLSQFLQMRLASNRSPFCRAVEQVSACHVLSSRSTSRPTLQHSTGYWT